MGSQYNRLWWFTGEYSWKYIPIGYRNEYKINDRWDGAIDIAARFQFDSKMTSYISSVDNQTFSLGNKPGLKVELSFTNKINSKLSLVVTPWYEYWGIKHSSWYTETVNGVPDGYISMEPDSHTN